MKESALPLSPPIVETKVFLFNAIVSRGGKKYRRKPDYLYLKRCGTLPFIFRKIRESRNQTKESLGLKIGFREEYVSGVEFGSRFPSLKYCMRCGDEFGANPIWVKNKWANWRVMRFRDALLKRLELDK